MKRYRAEVELLDYTKKKWNLYKSIDKEIEKLVKKNGIKVINVEYNNKLFIKRIIFEALDDDLKDRAFFEVGIFLGNLKLNINIITMVEIIPIVKKIKYLIKLIDPTYEKWSKFKDADKQIREFAKAQNILRNNVIFNNEDYSLSLDVQYEDEKSRENLNTTITEYLNKMGLHQEIVEAIEYKEYNNEVTDLPLYSANKLIDQANESLIKLGKM